MTMYETSNLGRRFSPHRSVLRLYAVSSLLTVFKNLDVQITAESNGGICSWEMFALSTLQDFGTRRWMVMSVEFCRSVSRRSVVGMHHT